jgi:hypothetical protein
VICHNLHLQRCLLTQKLSEHRPKPVYDGVTVADASTTVDDQQDSFSYWHRMLFRFTIDSAFVLQVTFARSVAAILTIFEYVSLSRLGRETKRVISGISQAHQQELTQTSLIGAGTSYCRSN